MITVITACLPSRADHIDELYESIARQTGVELEWVVVMDGQSDWYPPSGANFVITLVENPRNFGVSRSRNRGATLARGSVLRMIDADDYFIRPDALSSELACLETMGAAWVASRCDDFRDGEYITFGERTGDFPISRGDLSHGLANGLRISDVCPAAPNSIMIDRDAFFTVGGYSAVTKHEDAMLMLALSDRFHGYYLDDAHAAYRRAPGSLSQSIDPDAEEFYRRVTEARRSNG